MEYEKLRFPKSENSHESHELRHFWREVTFWGVQIQRSKIFRSMKMLVFATIIVFLKFSELG